MDTIGVCGGSRFPALRAGALLAGFGVTAGAAELPTARPADVGLSAGAVSTWAILDPEKDLVLILMSQYMVADSDFAGRFQTLAYQAIVD